MAVSAHQIAERARQLLDLAATRGRDPEKLLKRLKAFTVETPSWGYAEPATRFGRFPQPAAARTIEEKLQDAAQVHKLTGACPAVAVHALWDFPKGFDPKVVEYARKLGLRIGSISPGLFQAPCYRFGSFGNPDPKIRKQAVDQCLDAIRIGKAVKGTHLLLGFADGTGYPGQDGIRARKQRFAEALQKVHKALPKSMFMLLQYRPFEPAGYHSDIADWGMALLLARAAGPQAKVLVDIGQHGHGQNIEQIVAWLIDEEMLGGLRFNDRRHVDDGLTAGSIDPYQVFRIFNEVVTAEEERGEALNVACAVDQWQGLKPGIEAMIQAVTICHEMFAKALLVDRKRLRDAQARGDVVTAEEVLRTAFFVDTRPLIGYVRQQAGLEPDALAAHRASGYEARVAKERAARHGSASEAGTA